MILIGQYDSPYVRRVGIALRLYGLPFEHRLWSVFGDADRLRALNPLMRVPILVLDDGFVLSDSHMILDYIDNLAADPMFPRAEPARHRALKVAALATGLADKSVSLFYERRMHEKTSPVWEDRCRAQILSVLEALEADRASRPGPWWFGDQMGHADIAVACALRFTDDVHPGLIGFAHRHLQIHAETCESLSVFQDIAQPFIPPT
jgi:glutathione S-transferase